jgi:hypothetical protein
MDAQVFDLGGIAAVERRKRGECGKCHVFGE